MKKFYLSKQIFPHLPRCPGGPGPRLLRLLTSSLMPWFQLRPRPPAQSSSIRPGPRLALPGARPCLTPSRPRDLLFLISPRPSPSGLTGDNLPRPRPLRLLLLVMPSLLTPELPRLPLHLLTSPSPCHNE